MFHTIRRFINTGAQRLKDDYDASKAREIAKSVLGVKGPSKSAADRVQPRPQHDAPAPRKSEGNQVQLPSSEDTPWKYYTTDKKSGKTEKKAPLSSETAAVPKPPKDKTTPWKYFYSTSAGDGKVQCGLNKDKNGSCKNEKPEESCKSAANDDSCKSCEEGALGAKLWSSLYQDSDDVDVALSCGEDVDVAECEKEQSEQESLERKRHEKYKATEVKVEVPDLPDVCQEVCLTCASPELNAALTAYFKDDYKNHLYFKYTPNAFYDAQIHMHQFRQPQPVARKKSKCAGKKTK